LELGDYEDKEGGKEGNKETILEPYDQLCIVESIQTYENEDRVCQISPLDFSDIVFYCGHLVVVLPYRFVILPNRLWRSTNLEYECRRTALTEDPDNNCFDPFLVFAGSESADEGCNRASDAPI